MGSLFGQIVRTVVNAAALPLEVAKDVVTLGNVGESETYTGKRLRQLKDEAEERTNHE